MLNCGVIKESVFQYFQAETEVISSRQVCIVSLPIKGFNGSNTEVFVEEVSGEHVLVHDGGRTIGHLESSGLIVTEARFANLSDLAHRMGVTLDNGVFKSLSRMDNAQAAMVSVGQCCAMALFELIGHIPFSEEEQIRVKVASEVDLWSDHSGIPVESGVKVSGAIKQYRVDFVALTEVPVEVTILIPTYSPTVSAERYGMQVLDLRAIHHSAKRLAVLAKPEKWTRPSRTTVGKLADQLAEVRVESSLLPTGIFEALDVLTAKP